MSEPDEFIVKDSHKRCRGCGVNNSSLRRTAFKYQLHETKCLTAWICAKCTNNCKPVPSLLSLKALTSTFFLDKYNSSIFFIIISLELFCFEMFWS